MEGSAPETRRTGSVDRTKAACSLELADQTMGRDPVTGETSGPSIPCGASCRPAMPCAGGSNRASVRYSPAMASCASSCATRASALVARASASARATAAAPGAGMPSSPCKPAGSMELTAASATGQASATPGQAAGGMSTPVAPPSAAPVEQGLAGRTNSPAFPPDGTAEPCPCPSLSACADLCS